MKIIRLHIENFGKLHDFTLENIESLVSIYKENGWGKSTLADFIGAMLYGMPKKGNNKSYVAVRSKRKPWHGGVYGGSLDFECDDGRFRVVRTFADTPEGDSFSLTDLSTALVSEKFTKNLGEELFGVGRETFEITAFFPQLNLQGSINDEARANLTGANKFEYDLQNLESGKKRIAEKMRALKREVVAKSELEDLAFKKENLRKSLLALEEEKNTLVKQGNANLSEIKEKIDKELKIKSEIEGYNRKKNLLEGEIISLQSSLTTTNSLPRNSRGLIIGFSILLIFLLGGIIALGVTNVFELAGCIAIALVLIIGYVIGMLFIIKRPVKGKPDLEKENLLKLKQNEYKNYLQERVYEEARLQTLQMQYHTIDKDESIKNEKLKSINREYEQLALRLDDVQEELDKKTELSLNAQKNIKLLEKTIEFMKMAERNVSQRYIQPMQESFNRYFSALADKNISLNVNFEAIERTNLGDKEFEYLSQGYQDIVSICKRFALLEKIYEKEAPILILDDPFVNLDDEKLEIMKKIINNLSKRYQIFYLYCHKKNQI